MKENASHALFLTKIRWLVVVLPLILVLISSTISVAEGSNCSCSSSKSSQHLLDLLAANSKPYRSSTLASCLLLFVAASVSSAGGMGGGSLFIPILNLVAGLDLKTATACSAFMVTGGSLANVMHSLLFSRGLMTIDYEIAVLSQPGMLLGVSLGVICNIMFPEWLITVSFAVFLVCSTYRTCRAGLRCWNAETREITERSMSMVEGGGERAEALLQVQGMITRIPWKDMLILVSVWVCFFLLRVLMGDKRGQGAVNLKPCGVGYWFITFSQVPLSIAFTLCVVCAKKNSRLPDHQQPEDGTQEGKAGIRNEALPMIVFPLMALVTGVFSGLFGIGGGLLLNPVLLQIGVPPERAAATSSFMVMFSASMTTVQYVMLGMIGTDEAFVYAAVCFVASGVGLVVMKRVIVKSGRVSLIVFTVAGVMALSTVTIVCYGAVDVWQQYATGKYMGFKPPC